MADSRICSVEGCGKPWFKREWCSVHYSRWHTHGDPRWTAPEKQTKSKKYYAEVVLNYEGDECLIWPLGRASTGYARIFLNGHFATVSRLLCQDVNGPPPTPKHQAAHSCGRGHLGCVTKRHLNWATRSENEADKIRHGTSNRGARHGQAKLTADQVLEIRALEGQLLHREIADKFGITRRYVGTILSGITWGHL